MASKKADQLRFTRLRLRNWRNFREAEVRLGRRAFFIGPNASGKSNLFDALRFLRDLVKPVGGGLGAAVEGRGGMTSLRCLQAKGRNSQIEIEVDVGTDGVPNLWSYDLRFTKRPGEDFVTVLTETVRHRERIVSVFDRTQHEDPLRASQTQIEQVAQNEAFRPLAAFFGGIRYLHVIPQIVRDPRRIVDKGEDPFGGDLLRRVSEAPQRSRDGRLRRIAEALQIAVPQFTELRFERDTEGRPHLSAGFKHWRPNPSFHREELLSDGTLRLIGFLWSIGENGGPLLLEEPELSLHDAVARQLPIMIARMQRKSGRQVLLSTHSEALLSDPQIDPLEVHRLVPGDEGTTIETAADNPDIANLVKAGIPVGDAVMPLAKPRDVEQLSFLDVLA